jgi:hypothetical protein
MIQWIAASQVQKKCYYTVEFQGYQYWWTISVPNQKSVLISSNINTIGVIICICLFLLCRHSDLLLITILLRMRHWKDWKRYPKAVKPFSHFCLHIEELVVLACCQAFLLCSLHLTRLLFASLRSYIVTGDPMDITAWMDCWRAVAHDCRVLIAETQRRNLRGLLDLVTSKGRRQ